jgi:hypothetical protein
LADHSPQAYRLTRGSHNNSGRICCERLQPDAGINGEAVSDAPELAGASMDAAHAQQIQDTGTVYIRAPGAFYRRSGRSVRFEPCDAVSVAQRWQAGNGEARRPSPCSAGSAGRSFERGREMSGPEMRSPAPRCNVRNRAEVVRNEPSDNTPAIEPEGDFAAAFVARRYRLALPVARAVVALANLGRALQ